MLLILIMKGKTKTLVKESNDFDKYSIFFTENLNIRIRGEIQNRKTTIKQNSETKHKF